MLNLVRTYRDGLLYRRRRNDIKRQWDARHEKVFTYNPQYGRACDPEIEREHLRIWRPLHPKVNAETLRICANISGHAEPLTVPEDVFPAEIERCINPPDWPLFLSHKSMYCKFFPLDLFPETYLHNLQGSFFDSELRPVNRSNALAITKKLEYPVVLKPNADSGGGKGVCFPASPQELESVMNERQDFVVQRMVRQHAFPQSYNPVGLNTFRVYTYRSVVTDEVHVLNVGFRMGKGGSLDNLSAGGIVCYIRPDGTMNDFALDRYGRKFDHHPDNGLRFGPDRVIPHFDGLNKLALELGRMIPLMRMVGWDFCLTDEGKWGVIEVNLTGLTIRFSQYAGVPFFGEFTQEVIDHCLAHPRLRLANVRIS